MEYWFRNSSKDIQLGENHGKRKTADFVVSEDFFVGQFLLSLNPVECFNHVCLWESFTIKPVPTYVTQFQFDHEINSVLFLLNCAGQSILQQPPLI